MVKIYTILDEELSMKFEFVKKKLRHRSSAGAIRAAIDELFEHFGGQLNDLVEEQPNGAKLAAGVQS